MDNWTGTFSSRRSPGLSLGSQHRLFSTGTQLHKRQTLKEKTRIENENKKKEQVKENLKKTAVPANPSPVEEASASGVSDTTEKVSPSPARVSLRLDPAPADSSPAPIENKENEKKKKEKPASPTSSPVTSSPTDKSLPPAKKVKLTDNHGKASTSDNAEEESKDSPTTKEGASESPKQDAAKGKKQDKGKPTKRGRQVRFGANTNTPTTHQTSVDPEPKERGKKTSDTTK